MCPEQLSDAKTDLSSPVYVCRNTEERGIAAST